MLQFFTAPLLLSSLAAKLTQSAEYQVMPPPASQSGADAHPPDLSASGSDATPVESSSNSCHDPHKYTLVNMQPS